jgi:hypothetical protein
LPQTGSAEDKNPEDDMVNASGMFDLGGSAELIQDDLALPKVSSGEIEGFIYSPDKTGTGRDQAVQKDNKSK